MFHVKHREALAPLSSQCFFIPSESDERHYSEAETLKRECFFPAADVVGSTG